MTLSLELMTDTLPVGFAELEADAKTDGHGHLMRLAAEFAQSPAVFHAIFACHLDGRLAAIGAITDEPALTSQPTSRMRRLYVHRKFRRRKVARAIANALLQEAAANPSRSFVRRKANAAAPPMGSVRQPFQSGLAQQGSQDAKTSANRSSK
jgi:GNAT superfamily N-acetyltransferase